MALLAEQIRQLGMVAVIMACALGGTVGILKLIRFFLSWDFHSRRPGRKKSANGKNE